MKIRGIIKERIAVALVLVSLALLGIAQFSRGGALNTEYVSRLVGRRVASRMNRLETYVFKAPSRLPEDMVIYRYRSDTLYSWSNRFPINSDDISKKVLFQRLSDPRIRVQSPLAEVSDSLAFLNLGPKWFLMRSFDNGDSKVIAGLEIVNTLDEPSINGVNSRLALGKRYGIKPLMECEGSEVIVSGTPVFKVVSSLSMADAAPNAVLVWSAFAMLLLSCVLFLVAERTLRRLAFCLSGAFVVLLSMYLWGRFPLNLKIFSPSLFAGGRLLYSLGAVVIVNLAFDIAVGGPYLVRKEIASRIRSVRGHVCNVLISVALIAFVCIYVNHALRSIILNSNICLEVFKLWDLSVWSMVVYLSFLLLLLCVPMILQMATPSLEKILGIRPDFLSNPGRIFLSALFAIYLVAITSILGFDKEQGKVKLWADRLVVDRDMYLEMELRAVESRIEGDIFIPSFSFLDNAAASIENLVVDNYLSRIARNYTVRVFVSNDSSSPQDVTFLNERIRSGSPISENSHFLYIESSTGAPRYDGVFMYRNSDYGLSRVIVEVESVIGGREKGYLSIAGISAPGKISIPPPFGYARYRNGSLFSFMGSYAYPTRLGESLSKKKDGYTHFFNEVSPEEVVIISRPVFNAFNYMIAVVFIALLWYLMLTLMALPSHRRQFPESGYYKPRVSWVIMVSLTLTLIVMATVSVLFVYRRNTSNLKTMMSDRIGALQMMLQEVVKDVDSARNLRSRQMFSLIETVCTNMNSDVTFYAPDGSFLMSTSGEFFSRVMPRSRMDEDAFANIVSQNRRFFLQKESLSGKKYYNMYAPLMGADGNILAIMSSPYADMESYDFERDVATHSMAVFTLFLLLLMIARLAALAVVDMMFKPLSEMSRKMNGAHVDTLEYIVYERNDEISSLVQAYNRMVSELKESTRQLAQAERDKAWSGMARQVAHEIKNPLTPMKLQLQRLIRLKDKGDENWAEKFDSVSKLLLGHIDILTDTANEFSTFAKLYTEEATRIDLDTVLQEEISMFDNKDNIMFEYRGLQGASVMGPKPQLTRVFVNLINNAVQALEDSSDGRILLSLRNSSLEEGYYDIVFEDNGPGVSAENQEKLFTPNFTTKNGGSGLGLAISRSILEKCGATISYQKSFSLGGACFSIKYPKDLLSL